MDFPLFESIEIYILYFYVYKDFYHENILIWPYLKVKIDFALVFWKS